MKKWIAMMLLLIAGCSIDSGQTEGKESKFRKASFLPENNYHERKYYNTGEVTEDDFNAALYAAEEIYGPIVQRFGARLVVNGEWDNATVNAYADQNGDEWQVSFFGGLAKHPDMTLPGFVLVVCHELGHHLAGFPFYSDSPWKAAIEGQSDYFATASCARKMFDQNSPLRVWGKDLWKKRNPDQNGSNCNAYGLDSEVCKLSLDGGLSLGRVLAELSNERAPSYDTPSKVVVKKTMEKHPPAQCRIDTYKVGALCTKEWNDSVMPRNKSEADKVSCQKPKCWYAG